MQRTTILTTIAAAAFATACKATLREGDPAPPLSPRWLTGTAVDPCDDAVTVVDLWATWCGPCMDCIDDLDALQRRWQDYPVRIVSVAVRDAAANVEAFVAERGKDLAYTIAFDQDGAVERDWHATNYLPFAVVVGRDGRIAALSHPWYLDDAIANSLEPHVEDPAAAADFAALRRARDEDDWAELRRLADRRVAAQPDRGHSWIWKVRAQRDPAMRTATARQAIATLAEHGDAVELADLVHWLARDEVLAAVASDAHAALQRCSTTLPVLGVPSARMLAAAAVGEAELDAVIAAEGARLQDRLQDLLALEREFAFGVRGRRDVATARIRVHLLDAVAPKFGDARTAEPLLYALIAAEAGQERIDAAGLRRIAVIRTDAAQLNTMAWGLLQTDEQLPQTRSLALRAAVAMTEVPGWESPSHLDTLALVRFENGDVAGAVAAQQRAIAGLGRPRADYQLRLERYLAAAQANAGR